jgi:hypothetical protein
VRLAIPMRETSVVGRVRLAAAVLSAGDRQVGKPGARSAAEEAILSAGTLREDIPEAIPQAATAAADTDTVN